MNQDLLLARNELQFILPDELDPILYQGGHPYDGASVVVMLDSIRTLFQQLVATYDGSDSDSTKLRNWALDWERYLADFIVSFQNSYSGVPQPGLEPQDLESFGSALSAAREGAVRMAAIAVNAEKIGRIASVALLIAGFFI